MNEIMSIKGIRNLKEKPRIEYPENWENMVEYYIQTKKGMIMVKRKRGKETTYDEKLLLEAIEFLEER